ncbi:unnamed protein product [Vitrella brassicaformis CCMP3155]|uniref:Uncharacterized protein n=2 Tax=Vitrella brassicaformis TaxID=1169539 RepID=A0A0G4EHW7_VITBC|nr:unnamed protein product [Vitrella brassicaformis CCMP3155]|eukprot:CEL95519.1 unnamed protein product [Vitrella brassicaformis CCMP3155]
MPATAAASPVPMSTQQSSADCFRLSLNLFASCTTPRSSAADPSRFRGGMHVELYEETFHDRHPRDTVTHITLADLDRPQSELGDFDMYSDDGLSIDCTASHLDGTNASEDSVRVMKSVGRPVVGATARCHSVTFHPRTPYPSEWADFVFENVAVPRREWPVVLPRRTQSRSELSEVDVDLDDGWTRWE